MLQDEPAVNRKKLKIRIAYNQRVSLLNLNVYGFLFWLLGNLQVKDLLNTADALVKSLYIFASYF